MTCQDCKGPTKGSHSLFLCDRCAYKRQMKYVLKLNQSSMQKMLDDMIIYGEQAQAPVGLFGKPIITNAESTTPPLTLESLKNMLGAIDPAPNCRCTIEPSEVSWQASLDEALDQHIGDTDPYTLEFRDLE